MSSYTMQLKTYIEMFSQYEEGLTTAEKIEIGRKKLFDFNYPIFDEKYRSVFETNFIRNFYMREIGFETEGLFKFQLETWLKIHMPFFNKMYESELLSFDPLVNSEMRNESSRTTDRDSTVNSINNGNATKTTDKSIDGTQINDSFGRKIESDTPDNRLAITTADGSGVIEYASQIEEDKNNSSNKTTNNISGTDTDITSSNGNTISDITETEAYLQTRTGKVGSITYSKMLMEYRDSLIRVEKQIFSEMQQLFMLVY